MLDTDCNQLDFDTLYEGKNEDKEPTVETMVEAMIEKSKAKRGSNSKSNTCKYMFTKGVNKGNICKVACNGELCGKHSK